MPRQLARILFLLGLALGIVSFSRSALAAPVAGYCDDRGATAIAAPPVLDAPDVAVEAMRAARSGDCGGRELSLDATVAPVHDHAPVSSSSTPHATLSFFAGVPPAPVEHGDLAPVTTPSGAGVHVRVERPPRG